MVKRKYMVTILGIIMVIVIVGVLIAREVTRSTNDYTILKKSKPDPALLKSQVEDITPVSFFCEKIPDVSFTYKTSKYWHSEIKDVSHDKNDCRINLYWSQSIMPSIPYMSVARILVDGVLDQSKLSKNPHGIMYLQRDENSVDFFVGVDTMITVSLSLYSEAGVSKNGSEVLTLDRKLFWDSVISTFKKNVQTN